MKRSPISRKSPLKRSITGLTSSGRVKPMSTKRRTDLPTRAAVRTVVLARDVECRGRGLTPVVCAGRSTEVHELKRGAYRADCWLDPDRCLGLCSPCHAWVTGNPQEAVDVGLALWSWMPFPDEAPF